MAVAESPTSDQRQKYDGPTDDDIKATHPGFTVVCDKCGSKRVIVENTLGFSAESGAWGRVSLECQDCDHSADLYSP